MEQIMDVNNNKWLEKVLTAARVYDQIHELHTAEHFTQWLYKEYGIVYPEQQ